MEHLSKAPIKEAIIDLQVTLPENIKVESLCASVQLAKLGYPEENNITEGSVGLMFDENQSFTPNISSKLIGYRYTSEDSTKIVQFRVNGFTFSQLEPYVSWEEMKKEVKQLWDIYINVCNPSSIVRVATRYINILKIPMPVADIGDYLTEPPKVPKQLPQHITSFSSRFTIQKPELEANAIIIQSLQGIENNHAPITLDIDVFVTKEFSTEQNEYWDCLERLRTFKNLIFECSITKKTLRLFE